MQAGTDTDFADFAAVRSAPLLGFAHALTASPHDAWDLAQETLARVAERWARTRNAADVEVLAVRCRGTERLRQHAREHGPLRTTATRED